MTGRKRLSTVITLFTATVLFLVIAAIGFRAPVAQNLLLKFRLSQAMESPDDKVRENAIDAMLDNRRAKDDVVLAALPTTGDHRCRRRI
jgi:hypothetical protein